MDTCTCGTVLVEDAWFCHRCGKAQRELLTVEPVRAEPEPVIQAAVVVPPPPIAFRNAVALRVGFLTASVAAMLDQLPVVNVLFLLWSALAGFCAVMLYQRRTGQSLTVRSGAKMGLISSLLNAAILMIFSLLGFAMDAANFTAKLREGLSGMKARDPNSYASVESLLNTYGVATFVVLMFMMMAAAFTLAGSAGGALGAKVGKKD